MIWSNFQKEASLSHGNHEKMPMRSCHIECEIKKICMLVFKLQLRNLPNHLNLEKMNLAYPLENYQG